LTQDCIQFCAYELDQVQFLRSVPLWFFECSAFARSLKSDCIQFVLSFTKVAPRLEGRRSGSPIIRSGVLEGAGLVLLVVELPTSVPSDMGRFVDPGGKEGASAKEF
jgi:hypothetical protein